MYELDNDIKTNILFKKHLFLPTTNDSGELYTENLYENSYQQVFPTQIYSQINELPNKPPTDIINLDSGNDDQNNNIIGSYYGKTSSINTYLKKYIKVQLYPINSSNGKSFQSPSVINISNLTGNVAVGDYFYGETSNARGKIVKYESSVIYFINISGYSIDFQENENIKSMANNFSATFNNFNTSLNRILKDIVPITIGNGSYKISLYDKDNNDIFYNGKWFVDSYSGILTFFSNLPTNVSSNDPPKITFYKYVGKKGLNTVHTNEGYVGINTNNPDFTLDLNSTDCIRIPSGTTAERPSNSNNKLGLIRYNTETKYYESNFLDDDNNIVWKHISSGGSNNNSTIENILNNLSITIQSDSVNISSSTKSSIELDMDVNMNQNMSVDGTFSVNSNAIFLSNSRWKFEEVDDGNGSYSLSIYKKINGSYIERFKIN